MKEHRQSARTVDRLSTPPNPDRPNPAPDKKYYRRTTKQHLPLNREDGFAIAALDGGPGF